VKQLTSSKSTQICRDTCKSKCCKSTPPALTSEDLTRISNALGIKKEEFANNKNNYFFVKKRENSNDCYFLSDEGECKIYNYRPLDCQLFPVLFKIKRVDSSYLIKWYIWYCPLTDFFTSEFLIEKAKKIIIRYLEKDSGILFEYQSAMYGTGGYKRKHFLFEEKIP